MKILNFGAMVELPENWEHYDGLTNTLTDAATVGDMRLRAMAAPGHREEYS